MTDAEKLADERRYADKLMTMLLRIRTKDYDDVVRVAALKKEHDARRMVIRYHSSRTRNTERFVEEMGLYAETLAHPPSGSFVIITPTVGDGECPDVVLDYLNIHHGMCVGAIIGGNRNFGQSFAGAGKVIKEKFGIRTLFRFELAGSEKEVEICRNGILSLKL